MLRELTIRNFAIIDDLRVRFESGLTVITGETGVGKSILVNALNLVLGGRASAEMIRTGSEAAEVEAFFEVGAGSPAAQAAAQAGYETVDGILVRRVVSRTEANRVYLNGRLATLQVLSAVVEPLASISGQHAHQALLKEERHLFLLDQFGGLLAERAAVAARVRELSPLLERLRALRARSARRAERQELLSFQLREIDEAAPREGEDGELEAERLRLKNAAALVSTVEAALESLHGGEGSATERIGSVRRSLEKMGRIDPALAAEAEAAAELLFRLEERCEALRSYLKTVEFEEGRLEEIEARLDRLNRLKRKYGGSLVAVLEERARAAAELAAVERLEEEIRETEEAIGRLEEVLRREALALSARRRVAAQALEEAVARELVALKMKGTRFGVEWLSSPAETAGDELVPRAEERPVGESGFDRIRFTIAPNVGEALKPLAAIASGGELSRVVLALKSILARNESLATIVFDEVDAGIGGAVAEGVGRKLARLARHHQVICITHLPQIARFGTHHLRITKEVREGRTRSRLEPLDPEERTRELARMLGGEKITKLTLEHARELLGKT